MSKTQTTVTLNDSDWNAIIASCFVSESPLTNQVGYSLATLINVQRHKNTEHPINDYGRPTWFCPSCQSTWDDTIAEDDCPICSLSPDLSYIKQAAGLSCSYSEYETESDPSGGDTECDCHVVLKNTIPSPMTEEMPHWICPRRCPNCLSPVRDDDPCINGEHKFIRSVLGMLCRKCGTALRS